MILHEKVFMKQRRLKKGLKTEHTILVGVTKHVGLSILAPVIDRCLQDNFPGWRSPPTMNDQQLLPLILNEGEHGPVMSIIFYIPIYLKTKELRLKTL